MKKIYIFLFVCVAVLSAVAQTTPNLYRAVDKEKMNHWVDSVFDAMSYDERIGQLFMRSRSAASFSIKVIRSRRPR